MMKPPLCQLTTYLIITLFTGSCADSGNVPPGHQFSADVIVYGGTSSAVIAALQVAAMGKEVILVSPDRHLGGLTSSGLGWTDTGNRAVIGGLARDFYHRLYLHYQEESAWKWQERSEYGNAGQGNVAIDGALRTMWIFEPSAAEKTFDSMIEEADVPVYREELLDRVQGVLQQDVSYQCAGKPCGDHTSPGLRLHPVRTADQGFRFGLEGNLQQV